jgi:hypothetical protein
MEKLSVQDQHTYDAIFRHPTSGNIEWHALVALFNHIGEVIDEPNGKMKVICNGQTIVLHGKAKDATLEEIQDIRRFLKESGAHIEAPTDSGDFLLVLDHSEARIYRQGEGEAKPIHIEPYDPHGWDKHVHDTHEYAPPHTSALHHEFYEKIANTLKGAKRILVFGSGKGSSKECDQMFEDLKGHHSGLAEKVVGKENLDLSHMTEGEVLAKAREIFQKPLVILI